MVSDYFDKPLHDILQPLADVFGLTYGTWAAIDLQFGGTDTWISIAGWSQAISAYLWWFAEKEP